MTFHRWLLDTCRHIVETYHFLGIVAITLAVLTIIVVASAQILEDYWHARHS